MNREELVAAARAAAENAYSPYSNFRVGAVVVSADGETFTGANIENAAYPSSNCAEATAVHTAVATGVRKIDTLAVACIDAPTVQGSYPMRALPADHGRIRGRDRDRGRGSGVRDQCPRSRRAPPLPLHPLARVGRGPTLPILLANHEPET